MLDLVIEIAVFILVLFFLVPSLFLLCWHHRVTHRGHHGGWHEGQSAHHGQH